ncbi:MAG TPA: M28 family peptidase [Vicinamibacterales bacterium]|nr:M28 family peptidase [Vicinamibacterales bacterium]
MTSRSRRQASLVLAAVFITFMPIAAQNGAQKPSAGPWFGTPSPPAVSDPRQPVMKYDDAFHVLPAHFGHRPGRHDELLDGASLKADQKKIVDFAIQSLNAGDTVWGRRAATPAFMNTIEWAVNAMKTAGLKDAKVEPFAVPGTMWVPRSWKVQVIGDPAFGAGTESVTLQSAFPQPGGATIPDGTLTAPVIFVGHGTDADLAGRDVKGKIAVVHVRPEPSLFGSAEQGAAAKLAARDALGVINAVEGPGNAQYFDSRFACGKKPCFMVGGQDGWFLEQVIGKAANAGVLDKLKIGISLTSDEKGGLTSANGIAIIPGRSAKRIIINAHADAYFQGGDDNASGLALLVGLARYFAAQPKPEHTLMFVASGGHHGPGNGPASLAAMHPELKDGTVLILNLEHVAYADVVRGKVRATNNSGMIWEVSVTESAKAVGVTNESPFLFDLWSYASRCYGVATYQSAGTTVSGDLGGYRTLGVPMTQMIQSGTFYHSSGDVYEQVPAEGLERAARFHAFFIEQVDRAPEALIAAGKGTPYKPMNVACDVPARATRGG